MAIDNPINLTEKESPGVKREQTPVQPEQEINEEKLEVQPERLRVDQSIEQDIPKPTPTITQPVDDVVPAKQEDELTQEDLEEVEEVEDILEEDLGDVYNTLDSKTQDDFKRQGEQTAKAVVGLLHKVRTTSKAIIKTISKWLKIIPGLNRNFIEQESKIKADKIVEMHEHEHKHHDK